MSKEKIFGICIMMILFVFCLQITRIVFAEDCQDSRGPGTPSSVGNAEYTAGWRCECTGAIPTIVASSKAIAKGGSITLWVNSSGLACPPYTWSTSSKGHSLNITETENDLETVTLSCTTGTCGTNYDVVATVTVTDQCGETDEIEIRNTAGTYSVLLETCGVLDGWHQSVCYKDGFKFVVDHYNCACPETKSGDKCPDHPCCGCSSYYCAEGSEKWGWGCP